jgi:putative transposase
MANTYSQINIQCVFAVKGRENILHHGVRDKIHSYLSATLKSQNAYPLAVGGWKDHVHLFFELPVTTSVSKLMQVVKASSSKWINDSCLLHRRFNWQEGFGGFSYSKSQRDRVIQYIMNQELHHGQHSFRDEYLGLLNEFGIPFKNEYLFEFYD